LNKDSFYSKSFVIFIRHPEMLKLDGTPCIWGRICDTSFRASIFPFHYGLWICSSVTVLPGLFPMKTWVSWRRWSSESERSSWTMSALSIEDDSRLLEGGSNSVISEFPIGFSGNVLEKVFPATQRVSENNSLHESLHPLRLTIPCHSNEQFINIVSVHG
jgi:hypothetical protein